MEALSQLVLRAKGSRSMNEFANECEVNTSTISRIINMKNTTACSDDVLVSISKAADPSSGVTLEKLLAANGMVKLVPAGTEGAVVSPTQIVFGLSDIAEERKIEPDAISSNRVLRNAAKTIVGYRLEENYRETIQNAFLLNGYFVEMISYEKIIWPKAKQYRADFAIRTNALLDEGIDTWLFECKSYAAGISRGTIGKMNQLFTISLELMEQKNLFSSRTKLRNGRQNYMNVDYGIYITQGKKKLLGNRATVNGRDAIAYVKDGQLQSYAYMDDFTAQFYSGPRMNFEDSAEKKRM